MEIRTRVRWMTDADETVTRVDVSYYPVFFQPLEGVSELNRRCVLTANVKGEIKSEQVQLSLGDSGPPRGFAKKAGKNPCLALHRIEYTGHTMYCILRLVKRGNERDEMRS